MNPSAPSAANIPQSPASVDYEDDEPSRHDLGSSPQSQRSARSVQRRQPWNSTPRGQRSHSQLSVGGSVGKRSGTPALEYLRYSQIDGPYSPGKSYVDVPGTPSRQEHDGEDLDFELHDESLSDGAYDGLENVRACCDGRHTVGRSGRIHHHHHHHHEHGSQGHGSQEPSQQANSELMESLHNEPTARPVSPAWSFRSRTGSTHSHRNPEEGGGSGSGMASLFSWGRGEDGKLRFGSKRAKVTPSQESNQ